MKKKKTSSRKKTTRRSKKTAWQLPLLSKKRGRKSKKTLPGRGKLILFCFIAALITFAYVAGKYGFSSILQPASSPVPKPAQENTAAVRPSAKAVKKQTAAVTRRQPVVKRLRTLSADKPKIVFVIDDMGHTLSYRDELDRLGDNVTYAILPMLAHSSFYGNYSAKTGAEVILHLPLEAADGTIPGPGLITDRMPEPQILDVLDRALQSVPNHVGINNHMGSRGTSETDLMGIILSDLKKRHLFFLDSMTTSQSVSPSIARQIDLPFLKRDVFLDNVDSPAAIRTKVRELSIVAQKKGYAVGIGHYRYNTLTILGEEIPALKRQGYEIASLSELIHFLDSRG